MLGYTQVNCEFLDIFKPHDIILHVRIIIAFVCYQILIRRQRNVCLQDCGYVEDRSFFSSSYISVQQAEQFCEFDECRSFKSQANFLLFHFYFY